MASPTYALHRIRRSTRRRATPPPEPPTAEFDTYRETYRTIFEEVHVLGGDLALDDLSDWIVHRVETDEALPEPDAVRERALSICEEYDVIFPEESPLFE